MKPVRYMLVAFILSIMFTSCQKNTANPPTTSTGGNDTTSDPLTPVDSQQILKDIYLNNKTDLFIFYDGKEHKADSAYFDLRKNACFPIEDHFVVFLNNNNHKTSDPLVPCYEGCLEMSDGRTEQNIGSPHSVSLWRPRCKSLNGGGVANGFSLVVTELTDEHISGYFWYVHTWGSFNNVPIVR